MDMLDPRSAEAALDRWCEDVQSICGRFQTRPGRDVQRFTGTIEARSALGLDYASIETNARSLFRSRADVAADGDYYFLIYQARGRSEILQCGHSAVLSPGDMTLVRTGEPLEFIHRGLIRHLSFHLPGDVVRKSFGPSQVPVARRLSSHNALGSLIAGLVQQVHCRSTELSAIHSSALAEAMAALLVPLLTQDECGGAPEAVAGELEAVTATNVRRFVDANLRNPNISPRSIARALGCSVRHVHRAFETSGTTISNYIRTRRLESCGRELKDPVCVHETVTEIAFRWGFAEVSHFSRSFKEHFGVSPREYRMSFSGTGPVPARDGTNECGLARIAGAP
jgi:AraC-like DNA-binding protein